MRMKEDYNKIYLRCGKNNRDIPYYIKNVFIRFEYLFMSNKSYTFAVYFYWQVILPRFDCAAREGRAVFYRLIRKKG